MKKAIVVVSYGSLNAAALDASLGATEETFRRIFPEYAVVRAFTGKRILKALAERGTPADSVESALARLADAGFREVALQPTHIIAGSEFSGIAEAARRWKERFGRDSSIEKISVGAPLLQKPSDIEPICRFFAKLVGFEKTDDFEKSDGFRKSENAGESAPADALLLMGHGSDSAANQIYSDFAVVSRRLGYDRTFIATLEASPRLEDVLPEMQKAGVRNVVLAPLLFSAGEHVARDMAGDAPDSWKSRLQAAGFTIYPVIKGLGEYAEIRELYAERLRRTLGVSAFSEKI